MYLDYFGFDEPPFSITPDPKFVFLSKKHEESLAHLVYGISRGGGAGFVQLTGEVGTGKTTISRLLLDQIPDKTNIALILNPTLTPLELIQNICKELKVSMRGIKGKLNTLIDKLNNYLLKSWSDGENTVVIIDEAQNLPRDTLEQLRLLTNLETNTHKLLQIILIGQPELRSTMRRNDLRQLAQRVTARYHLMPLDVDETYDYLQHRITVAGGDSQIVTKSIAKIVHKTTGGVPRLINILMDRALLAAYSDDSKQVKVNHIKTAAVEVMPETNQKEYGLNLYLIGSVLILFVLIYYISVFFLSHEKVTNPEKEKQLMLEHKELKQTYGDIGSSITMLSASTADVWKKYFELWDAKSNKVWLKAKCPNISDIGMDCLRRQGNLKQIIKLNHPVVLQLEDGSITLLLSMNSEKLGVLDREMKTIFIDKPMLDNQWLGTYFIIWPMPAELLIDPDDSNLSDWALEMANTLSTDKVTESQLKDWIIDFQKKYGLLADGIIGKETQMTLSLMAYNGPTLNYYHQIINLCQQY